MQLASAHMKAVSKAQIPFVSISVPHEHLSVSVPHEHNSHKCDFRLPGSLRLGSVQSSVLKGVSSAGAG